MDLFEVAVMDAGVRPMDLRDMTPGQLYAVVSWCSARRRRENQQTRRHAKNTQAVYVVGRTR